MKFSILKRREAAFDMGEADRIEKERIRSEAKALKAMCYFDLLRL